MIAGDTSSLISYFGGEKGKDVSLIDNALEDGLLVLPPPVLSELLSDPAIPGALEKRLKSFPILAEMEGFWERAGILRRSLLKKGKKARLADSLICQFCLDHNVPLITRDEDFFNFREVSNLILL